MARPLRIQPAGELFHLWARGNRRQPIYLDVVDRQRFLALLFETVRRYGWVLHSYCLMNNHYHLIVELGDEGSLSPGMQWLNGVYAMYFNRRHCVDGHLFQGRFKSRRITDSTDLITVDRYILWNPVRAGLCRSPADWPWSSYHGLIATRRILGQFGATFQHALAAYRRWLLTPFPRAGP